MNDTFNFRRFGNFLAAEARRAVSSNGVSLLVFCLMGVIVYAGAGAVSMALGGSWHCAFQDAVMLPFFVLGLVLSYIVFPSKIYGGLTDRKSGSSFVVLPVSVTEKFLSMLLLCLVAVPLVFSAVYMAADALAALLDSSLEPVAVKVFRAANFAQTLLEDSMTNPGMSELDMVELASLASLMKKLMSPVMMAVSFFELGLYFLLGAICFRKNKIAKTVLVLIGIGFAASACTVPLAGSVLGGNLDTILDDPVHALKLFRSFVIFGFCFEAAELSALVALVFLRLKTIKF